MLNGVFMAYILGKHLEIPLLVATHSRIWPRRSSETGPWRPLVRTVRKFFPTMHQYSVVVVYSKNLHSPVPRSSDRQSRIKTPPKVLPGQPTAAVARACLHDSHHCFVCSTDGKHLQPAGRVATCVKA